MKSFSGWFPLLLIGLALSFGQTAPLQAHEIRPALLEIHENSPGWFDVTWKVPALGDSVLAIDPVFPPDLVPMGAPSTQLIPGALLTRTTYRAGGGALVGEAITVDGLSALQIDVLVQITLADGTYHSGILRPQSPTFEVPAHPTKGGVAWSYWIMGIGHILSGFDHLLFVLALMLIVSNLWMLFKAVTAFTVAHTVTLGLATLGFVNVPPAPTEAIISLSILFLAVEVVHRRQGRVGVTERYPWIVAFIFGLFHGLGFAGALSDFGLPQGEIPLALLMFNVGVETGQLMFISAVLILMAIPKRLGIRWPTGGWRLAPYAIGCLAAFWTIQRFASFL